ncbi:TetR/AcrR family transcriptional regulator [Isoptericola sp. NEAU-Y5]|uniref:TetR/AcrR family transcriptional regulator n=1 Tax=Isoptericola luteus TaxID=2879484 RepID=A0ABS7ZBA3_9MICO|nr:TetR/AcrR family transcriptional regulator [Isoptericola sp. NEAU-Y5]MCA5892315.1 TetR/AcrR family transcriptional regulator [Isoptericola sp. NEAU-Y5]
MAPSSPRRARQLSERRDRILAAARDLAEEQGWEAVTTRRLADAIEYSQPVLYGHFPQGRTEIVTAVALTGFEELAVALGSLGDAGSDAERMRALVRAYLDFAGRHPATYDAMFLLPVLVPFASDDTPAVVRQGFDAITSTLSRLESPPDDVGTAAEVLWGAVHGLAALHRAGRLAAGNEDLRIEALVRLVAGGAGSRDPGASAG